MATRAVPVSVERSPGNGFGWYMQVDGETLWRVGSAFTALGWVRQHLERLGADEEERGRVLWLLVKELEWKRRACVTAEVAADVETAGARVFAAAVDLLLPGARQ